MRNDRTCRYDRHPATPEVWPGSAPGIRGREPRLWPVLTVLRRVERLVEAESRRELENAVDGGGGEPNA